MDKLQSDIRSVVDRNMIIMQSIQQIGSPERDPNALGDPKALGDPHAPISANNGFVFANDFLYV